MKKVLRLNLYRSYLRSACYLFPLFAFLVYMRFFAAKLWRTIDYDPVSYMVFNRSGGRSSPLDTGGC